MVKRVFVGTVVMLVLVLAFVAGGYAAAKSYQFTGVVQSVDSGSLTVQKSAKETWQFELGKDTKGGPPKVGDRVTVYYKMVATEIEAGAAPSTAAKKKK
jgi:hypothetical protein